MVTIRGKIEVKIEVKIEEIIEMKYFKKGKRRVFFDFKYAFLVFEFYLQLLFQQDFPS